MTRHLVWLSLLLLVVFIAPSILGVGMLEAVQTGDSTQPLEARDPLAPPGHRYREGTRLADQIGHFKVSGDRVTFYSDQDKRRFTALENLALERVARTVTESSDALQWSVSGVVTEFRGQNYLLVTRAIVKSNTSRD